jgi:hypothetical protein
MNDPSLKAREIEALTFICPADAPSVAKHARSPLRRWTIPRHRVPPRIRIREEGT